jgi:hypothetical protein
MQAGLTTRRLTLREIFLPALLLWLSEKAGFGQSTVLLMVDDGDASGGIANNWLRKHAN